MSVRQILIGRDTVRSGKKNFKLLICGNINLPPPMGGLARRIINHSKVLCNMGVDIHLLSIFHKEKIDLSEVPFKIHYLLDVKAKETKKSYIPIFLTTLHKQLFFALRHPIFTLKVTSHILKMIIKGCFTIGWFILSILYIKKIVELVEKESIDIICTYYAFEPSFLAIKAAKFCNKPIVIETFAETIFMKDKPEDTNKAEIYVPLFKYIFNNVNCVIAPSQHCLNGAKQYIKRQKILAKVIISGIDLDRLLINVDKEEQKKVLGYKNNKIVLFVNRLDWTKGPQYIIQAAPAVLDEIPNVIFIFIGRDAGAKVHLQKIIEQKNLKNHVIFMGTLPDEELKKYYAASDVLVFPSTTKRECMGMSMKEAMASGTPVIAFDAGGASEAIEYGVSGYVVKVGDINALAQTIIKILSNDKLRREMSNFARRRAFNLFDKNKTGKELYNTLIYVLKKYNQQY